jgi:diaminopimelate epimerase
MDFAKLHGLGNDFLVINAGDPGTGTHSLAVLTRRLCDRHLGIGADGVVYFQPTVGDPDAGFSALIFNADGSRAEMSGNGIRCAAAFLVHSGIHTAPVLGIRTVSGVKNLFLVGREALIYRFRCSMGLPVFEPGKIPVQMDKSVTVPVIDYPIQLGSETIQVSLSSMGNPHCSTFWADVDAAPLQTIGPQLESHSRFPKRANVEFIQVLDQNRIRVRFWERGVGLTLSSGTGSSAAAVASILKGLVRSPVTVQTELGSLKVEWEPGSELFLTGPAEFICGGTFPEAKD